MTPPNVSTEFVFKVWVEVERATIENGEEVNWEDWSDRNREVASFDTEERADEFAEWLYRVGILATLDN